MGSGFGKRRASWVGPEQREMHAHLLWADGGEGGRSRGAPIRALPPSLPQGAPGYLGLLCTPPGGTAAQGLSPEHCGSLKQDAPSSSSSLASHWSKVNSPWGLLLKAGKLRPGSEGYTPPEQVAELRLEASPGPHPWHPGGGDSRQGTGIRDWAWIVEGGGHAQSPGPVPEAHTSGLTLPCLSHCAALAAPILCGLHAAPRPRGVPCLRLLAGIHLSWCLHTPAFEAWEGGPASVPGRSGEAQGLPRAAGSSSAHLPVLRWDTSSRPGTAGQPQGWARFKKTQLYQSITGIQQTSHI